MRYPPLDEPHASDGLILLLGVLLACALAAVGFYLLNQNFTDPVDPGVPAPVDPTSMTSDLGPNRWTGRIIRAQRDHRKPGKDDRQCANTGIYQVDGLWVCGVHRNMLIRRGHTT